MAQTDEDLKGGPSFCSSSSVRVRQGFVLTAKKRHQVGRPKNYRLHCAQNHAWPPDGAKTSTFPKSESCSFETPTCATPNFN